MIRSMRSLALMGALLLATLELSACGTHAAPPNPWKPSPRVIHVDIVTDKYELHDCVEAGGTWVVAQNKDWLNVFVGCIESPPASQERP